MQKNSKKFYESALLKERELINNSVTKLFSVSYMLKALTIVIVIFLFSQKLTSESVLLLSSLILIFIIILWHIDALLNQKKQKYIDFDNEIKNKILSNGIEPTFKWLYKAKKNSKKDQKPFTNYLLQRQTIIVYALSLIFIIGFLYFNGLSLSFLLLVTILILIYLVSQIYLNYNTSN